MIYTVTLNPSLDYIAFTDSINLGKTNRTRDEYIVPGGKGINISILLSRLDLPTTALGFAGGFTGDKLIKLLENENINCDFSKLDSDTRINFKLSCGEITEFNGSGATLSVSDIKSIKTKIKTLQSGDWLCLSGSIPNGVKSDIYKELALCVPTGVKVVVDTAGEPLLKSLDTKPFLIKPNIDELCDIFACEISIGNIEIYAKKLQKMGAKNVMVSCDKDGAFLLDMNGNTLFQKAPKGNAVNTVAAGDSMIAGFIKHYLDTESFAESLKFAVACGSATAFSKWIAKKEMIYTVYENM
ncbi:MAG: 1-phosphofructokinase [Clostridia bacterium]|nr:1-phosphofructokinase [Clostridia bacterium]